MNDQRRRGFQPERFPFNVFRAIGHFFRWLGYLFTWPIRRLTAERSRMVDSKPPLVRRILYPFLWLGATLIQVLANALDLMVHWSRSRQIREFVYGMPAVIVLGGFIFVVTFLYSRRERNLVDVYLLNATRAENSERYDTARMYYRKLLQLDPGNESYDYYVARSFDAEGKTEEALIRMRKLLKSPSMSGSVNYWFAGKTLEREDVDDLTKLKYARRHLRLFLEGSPRHLEANELGVVLNGRLAALYQNLNDADATEDALLAMESHAEKVGERDPKSLLRLANVQMQVADFYDSQGAVSISSERRKQAHATARRFIKVYEKQVAADSDAIEPLLRLSDGYLFEQDFGKAIQSIDHAIRNDVSKSLVPKLIEHKSNVLAKWAESILAEGTEDLTRAIELIDQSIQLDFTNKRAMTLLAQITVLSNEKISLIAKQKLDRALDRAAAPFAVHMVLGSNAAQNENDEVAVRHLRQALLINRKAPAAMNNLAYVLARLPEPKYDEAIALINSALKILPGNPRFLDTRGNIYLSLKKYEQAFHDFEIAEQQIKDNQALYENLVFLSRHLGFEQHRKKFESRLQTLEERDRRLTEQ